MYTHVNAISVVVEVDATFDCATSNCGAHVHSGSSCATTATQGGHLVNANGEDPWTGKMQFQSTNLATGRSLYTIEVAAGNVAILGKPFIVLNNAGARAMCGMLGRKEYAFEGTLSALTPATETGSVSLYTKGSTLSLVVEADSTLACTAGNCGGHVHSGSGCATTGARGPNMLNADGVTDAWGGKVLTLVSTDTGTAKSTYTVEVPAGNPAVLGKPFVVTNAAGTCFFSFFFFFFSHTHARALSLFLSLSLSPSPSFSLSLSLSLPPSSSISHLFYVTSNDAIRSFHSQESM